MFFFKQSSIRRQKKTKKSPVKKKLRNSVFFLRKHQLTHTSTKVQRIPSTQSPHKKNTYFSHPHFHKSPTHSIHTNTKKLLISLTPTPTKVQRIPSTQSPHKKILISLPASFEIQTTTEKKSKTQKHDNTGKRRKTNRW